MNEELLNRIALTWGNRTRQRQLRSVLNQYPSATEAAAHHPEMMSRVARLMHMQLVLSMPNAKSPLSRSTISKPISTRTPTTPIA